MPDTDSTSPASILSGKRSRSEYESRDGEVQPGTNGYGDVEGLCCSMSLNCQLIVLIRLFI